MVQLRIYPETEGFMAFEDSQDANMTARSQDYWALDDVSCCSELKLQEGLKKRGIIYNQTSHSLRGKPLEVNSRLAKLHSRSERGLLLYEDIATSELRKFVAARGLEPDVNYARKNKKYLEALLERADEEATFPHFEELPIELREFVYGHYFKALETKIAHLPLLPPVVNASRLLRSESLPIFYDLCTFYHHQRFNGFDQLRLTTSQENHLARVRHLQIGIFTSPLRFGHYQSKFNISLNIDMPMSGGALVFRVGFVEGDDITPFIPMGDWAERRIARAGELVEEFLLKLKTRSETVLKGDGDVGGKDLVRGLGLQRDDFQSLLWMLQDSFPDG